MAEPGPFPRACEAQKSGQSWHHCPPFLTRSPLAEGSKAPALLEFELDHVGRGRRPSEGVEVSGPSALWPGPQPNVSTIGHKHRGTLRASSRVSGTIRGRTETPRGPYRILGNKAGTWVLAPRGQGVFNGSPVPLTARLKAPHLAPEAMPTSSPRSSLLSGWPLSQNNPAKDLGEHLIQSPIAQMETGQQANQETQRARSEVTFKQQTLYPGGVPGPRLVFRPTETPRFPKCLGSLSLTTCSVIEGDEVPDRCFKERRWGDSNGEPIDSFLGRQRLPKHQPGQGEENHQSVLGGRTPHPSRLLCSAHTSHGPQVLRTGVPMPSREHILSPSRVPNTGLTTAKMATMAGGFSSVLEGLFAKELSNQAACITPYKPYSKHMRWEAQRPQIQSL